MEASENTLRKNAKEMMKINSENPPGNETEMVHYLEEKFKELGMKYQCIETAPNRVSIIGETNKGKKTTNLVCHSDTVPLSNISPEPIEEDGKIFGRGSVDDKGAIAAGFETARMVIESGLDTNFMLSIFSDEENGSVLGAKAILQEKSKYNYNPDFSLVAEANSLNISIGEKGIVRFRAKCMGKEAHAMNPEKGVNAILLMNGFIQALNAYSFPNSFYRQMNVRSTVNVGVIRGGIKQSIVPKECEVDVDFRLVPGQADADVMNGIRAIEKNLKQKNPAFNLSVSMYRYDKAHVVNKKSEKIQLLEKVLKEKGLPAEYGFASGATIAKFLTTAGLEAVVCGPGKSFLCHAAEEHVEIKELKTAAEVYYDYARRLG
ncbi:MAG: M20/M25/M40 family metallo-hydrolase [Candidatus Diapherotrites archaeon]|nr:M20/M25/M40 family metallo-hydrolase [Candidatus Diapherotrites archaeon]